MFRTACKPYRVCYVLLCTACLVVAGVALAGCITPVGVTFTPPTIELIAPAPNAR